MKWNIVFACMLIAVCAKAQTFSEKVAHKLTFEKKSPENALIISNINGSINVVGYDGSEILVDAEKTINGKTQARLDKGKTEVQVNVINQADTLIVYVKDGCNSYGPQKRHSDNDGNRWGYNWNNCGNNCQIDYDYHVNITVKVPSNVNIIATTINDGDIDVKGVSASVKANNINGSIRLANLKTEAEASTINGDVDVAYASNPPKNCRFYSLNGDINALFPKGLGAELSFESFNGSFYTNIAKVESLPVQVKKTDEKEGVKFKVAGNHYRVGNGGAYLDFETFNGDVYLKEIE